MSKLRRLIKECILEMDHPVVNPLSQTINGLLKNNVSIISNIIGAMGTVLDVDVMDNSVTIKTKTGRKGILKLRNNFKLQPDNGKYILMAKDSNINEESERNLLKDLIKSGKKIKSIIPGGMGDIIGVSDEGITIRTAKGKDGFMSLHLNDYELSPNKHGFYVLSIKN